MQISKNESYKSLGGIRLFGNLKSLAYFRIVHCFKHCAGQTIIIHYGSDTNQL